MFQDFLSGVEQVVKGSSVLDDTAHAAFITLCRVNYPAGSAALFLEQCAEYIVSGCLRNKGSSFAHENGFTKIALEKYGREEQLRLHIWPKESYADSNAHSHRWNLSSYILAGELEGMNYAIVDGNDIKFSRLFDAVDGLKERQFLNTGSLILTGSYALTKGCGHYLDHLTVHRVRKAAGTTAISLMISGPPRLSHSISSQDSQKPPKARSFLTADAIRDLLLTTARSIRGEGDAS